AKVHSAMAFSKTLKSKRHKKAQDNTKYQKGNIFVNFVPFCGYSLLGNTIRTIRAGATGRECLNVHTPVVWRRVLGASFEGSRSGAYTVHKCPRSRQPPRLVPPQSC